MENEKVLQLGTLFRLTQFKPDRLAFLHEVGMNACQLCGIDDNYLAGKTGGGKYRAACRGSEKV